MFTSVLERNIQADQLGKLLVVVLLTADLLRNCCSLFLFRQYINNGSTKAKD